MASSSQQLDDLFDGAVGLVVGGFEFRQWCGGRGWVAAEGAVSERTADALVEKDKEQGLPQHAAQLAVHALIQAPAEDLGDAVRAQP